MKKIIAITALILASIVSLNAQNYNSSNSEQASIRLINNSDYTMTVKLMRSSGSLYSSAVIPSKGSRTFTFSSSGSFYTKTKFEKSYSPTLYKKGSSFKVQCDQYGYTSGSLEFYVSSSGSGSAGQTISRSEFEKNN